MKNVLFIISLSTIIAACSTQPVPINFGQEDCSYCRMLIADERYGGELVTTRGKVYKFDSIECMTAYILKEKKGSDDIKNLWTINFSNPGYFIDVSQSWFLVSDVLKSPMGLNLSAYDNPNTIQKTGNLNKGKIIRWQEVKAYVNQSWLEK